MGYGPVSPQLPSDIGGDYARMIQFDLNVAFGGMSEDCLRLNIWTPATSGKRAVLVSIHGGRFVIGSRNHPMYHEDCTLAARSEEHTPLMQLHPLLLSLLLLR